MELDKFTGGLLYWLQIGFTSRNGLVKEAHLELAERFIEVEASIPSDKPTHVLLRSLLLCCPHGLGFIGRLSRSFLLVEQNCELPMRHLELARFEEARSLVKPGFVVQSLIVPINQFLECLAGLIVLLKLVQVAADKEGVWEALNVGNGVLPEIWVIHAYWFDQHHAETEWVEELLETASLMQECQHLDVVVHYMVVLLATLSFSMLALLILVDHIDELGVLL